MKQHFRNGDYVPYCFLNEKNVCTCITLLCWHMETFFTREAGMISGIKNGCWEYLITFEALNCRKGQQRTPNHKVSMWQQWQRVNVIGVDGKGQVCVEVRFHSQWCRRWWLRWGPRWRWCSCVWRTARPGCRRSAAPACERQAAQHTLHSAWHNTTLGLLLCIHVLSGLSDFCYGKWHLKSGRESGPIDVTWISQVVIFSLLQQSIYLKFGGATAL